MKKESKFTVLIFIAELILAIILCAAIMCILYYPFVKEKYFNNTDDSSVIASTEEFIFKSTDKETLYNILPGYTYYEDKGSMKLYADIIPTDNNLMIIGVQYHQENFKNNLMPDANIKEVFYLQEDGSYRNKDNTITVHLKDDIAEFKDIRKTVSLPYNGTLKLIPAPIEYNKVSNIESGELFNDDNIIVNSKVEDVKIDSLDNSTTPDNYISGKDFIKHLTSDNERKDFTFTAKYIESTEYSGVKYQEINTGTYLYTFGAGFPYDSKVCNTVTITATYRGYNKRFNGLSMDDSYPCFVTISIRKPNKQEANP